MITLPRRQAHALRAVLRRSALGIAHRGPVAPIVFTAGDGQLRARYRYAHLAIEHATPLAWPSGGSAALPRPRPCANKAGSEAITAAITKAVFIAPDRFGAAFRSR